MVTYSYTSNARLSFTETWKRSLARRIVEHLQVFYPRSEAVVCRTLVWAGRLTQKRNTKPFNYLQHTIDLMSSGPTCGCAQSSFSVFVRFPLPSLKSYGGHLCRNLWRRPDRPWHWPIWCVAVNKMQTNFPKPRVSIFTEFNYGPAPGGAEFLFLFSDLPRHTPIFGRDATDCRPKLPTTATCGIHWLEHCGKLRPTDQNSLRIFPARPALSFLTRSGNPVAEFLCLLFSVLFLCIRNHATDHGRRLDAPEPLAPLNAHTSSR